jgi:hypothetical protein
VKILIINRQERKIMCSVSLNNGFQYKLMDLRWDLIKGFTQLCTQNDCNEQQDRLDVLKAC